MKISELIEKLRKIEDLQGDVEVYMQLYEQEVDNINSYFIHLGKLERVCQTRAGGVYLTGSN